METNKIYQGDCLEVLKSLPNESINMCMTSPPYWALRDYGVDGQLGLESTFQEYINRLCDIFDEVKRVLRKDGSCWVVIGDTYYTKSGSGFIDDNMVKRNKKEVDNTTGINKANELRGKKQYWNGKNFVQYIEKKEKYCCQCGNKFMGYPNQYFCSSKCSGVDNTPRVLKGEFPNKTLTMIPFRFAIEMVNRGWILRNTIIWHKRNTMPTSVKDRFTVDFEYLFFFVKSKKYYFKQQREPHKIESIKRTFKKWDGHREKGSSYVDMDIKNMCHPDGRNKRTVWTINPKGFKGSHFAVFPEKLCETPIRAGCPKQGVVLDPFFGAGTTGVVSLKQDKKFIGIELNPEYIKIAEDRLKPFKEQTKLFTES